jgi:hypothetical protein
MAQKRMFDRAIIEQDKFLNISLSAKAIYFLLGMEADDEGFVAPNRILRLYGGEAGDLKNLVDTGLVIPFKTGVLVITDWNQNNWLDNRRIKPTIYQKEKKQLTLTEDKQYVLSGGLATAKIEESRIEEKSREEHRTSEETSQVNPLIELFKEVNPSYSKLFANKTQRGSAERLLKTHGLPKLSGLIKLLPQMNGDKYAPVITTPVQLEDKFGQLIAYGQRKQANAPLMI